MAERIDSIVSQQAYDELDSLINKIIEAEKVADKVEINIGSPKSIIELNAALKTLDSTTKAVTKITNQAYQAQRKKNLLDQQELRTKKLQIDVKKKEAQIEKSNLVLKDKVNKALRQEEKLLSEVTNEYKLLSKASNDANLKYKNYALTLGKTHPVTLEARDNARWLRQELKDLDAEVLEYNRNVGNYNSVGAQFNQLLREAPNAGISFRTFLMSITNNVSYFAEAIKGARAQGQSWRQIIGTMGKSLTGVVGIVNLAIVAITAFGLKALSAKDDTEELTEATDDLTRAFSDNIKQLQQRRDLFREYGKSSEEALKNEIRLLEAQGAPIEEIREAQRQYNKLRIANLTDEKNRIEGVIYATNTLFERAEIRGFKAGAAQEYVIENLIGVIQRQTKVTAEEAEKQANAIVDQYVKSDGIITGLEEDRATLLREIRNLEVEEQVQIIEYQKQIREDVAKQDEKLSKEAAKNAKELEELRRKELLKTQSLRDRLLQARQTATQAGLSSVIDDSGVSVSQRLGALEQYWSNRQFIIEENRKKELEANKNNEERIAAINAFYDIELNNAEIDFYNKQNEIVQQGEDQRQKTIIDSIKSIENARLEAKNEELKALIDQYETGLIDLNEFNSERQAINYRYTKEATETQIAHLQNILSQEQITGDMRIKAQELLNKALNDLYNQDANNKNNAEQEKRRQIQNTLRLVQQASQVITTLLSIEGDALKGKLDGLKKEEEQIDKNYERELIKINNSTLSEEEKQEKIRQEEAKTNAARSENEARQREASIKQAQINKAAAITQIIAQTALSIVKTLTEVPFPANIAASAVIGALGAAQLVRAQSAPLPQYAEGTQDHEGGKFIAGERESELVVRPDGTSYWTANKPTVYNEPKHTKVFNQKQLNEIIAKSMGHPIVEVKKDKNESREILNALDRNAYVISKSIRDNKTKVNFKNTDNSSYRSRKGIA